MATKSTNVPMKATKTSAAKTVAAKNTNKVVKSVKTAPKTAKPAKKVGAEVRIAEKKKILFVASEVAPFIQAGGIADVISSLAKALAANGNLDVRVVLPLYSDIKKADKEKFSYVGNIYVHLAWRNQYCGIFEYVKDGVTFYFIDNEFYFKRPGCYGYFDDGERFAFFSRSVLEIMPIINFYPDVMHCHDWQSALAAIYLKTNYCFRPEYQFIRALFTIHNIEYQGWYSLDLLNDLFDIYESYQHLVEFNNSINLMKGAIECCERVSTVSPKYADELKNEYFANGLDSIISKNHFKLSGILNGIDDDYNCATDLHLYANYTPEDFSNKALCKKGLQKLLGLPQKARTPVIGMVTSLIPDKGLDLVTAVIEDLLQDDVQMVILGAGDARFEGFFSDLARRYPDKFSANIAFNDDLARKIYSGSDIFLMPSRLEPCGLSQMIACRYGTVPVVRETGGLCDSIKPLENGYSFANYNAHDMLYVICQAISDYRNKEEWEKLMYRAATTDFSWNRSAKLYEALYYDMLK